MVCNVLTECTYAFMISCKILNKNVLKHRYTSISRTCLDWISEALRKRLNTKPMLHQYFVLLQVNLLKTVFNLVRCYTVSLLRLDFHFFFFVYSIFHKLRSFYMATVLLCSVWSVSNDQKCITPCKIKIGEFITKMEKTSIVLPYFILNHNKLKYKH